MRLTCLKCGHQFQVSVVDAQLEGYGYCLCGTEHVFPDVITPGIFPSDRAAEISRTRAFRAARVVKDIGGWAFKLTLFWDRWRGFSSNRSPSRPLCGPWSTQGYTPLQWVSLGADGHWRRSYRKPNTTLPRSTPDDALGC